jgi:hypothetical protein
MSTQTTVPTKIDIQLDIQWNGNTPTFKFSSSFEGVYPDGSLDLRDASDDAEITISLVPTDVVFASPTIAIVRHRDKTSTDCPNPDDKGLGVFTIKALLNSDRTFKLTDKNNDKKLFSYALWFVSETKGRFPCDPIIINK